MKIKELHYVSDLMNKIQVSKLEVKDVKKVIELHRLMSKEMEEFNTLQRKLLDSYKVEIVGGNYNWKTHKDTDEINKKVNDLNMMDIEVPESELNFLEIDDFYSSTKETLMVNEISFLYNYLVIK